MNIGNLPTSGASVWASHKRHDERPPNLRKTKHVLFAREGRRVIVLEIRFEVNIFLRSLMLSISSDYHARSSANGFDKAYRPRRGRL